MSYSAIIFCLVVAAICYARDEAKLADYVNLPVMAAVLIINCAVFIDLNCLDTDDGKIAAPFLSILSIVAAGYLLMFMPAVVKLRNKWNKELLAKRRKEAKEFNAMFKPHEDLAKAYDQLMRNWRQYHAEQKAIADANYLSRKRQADADKRLTDAKTSV